MKDAKSILDDVLEYTKKSKNGLATIIGLKRSQNLYDIESGKVKNISSELSEKITIAYPAINRNWLLTGRGEMLKTPENESYTENHEPKGEWPPDIANGDTHRDYRDYVIELQKEKILRLEKENQELKKNRPPMKAAK